MSANENGAALKESRKASDQSFSTDSSDNTTLDCPLKAKTWIEIQLVGEDGEPISGKKLEIELPDGTKKTATFNKEGKARFEGIAKGECQVALLGLDREAWEPVS